VSTKKQKPSGRWNQQPDGPCTVVEVAGIEPASESLQRAEPTCVSVSFSFANAAFEPARTMRR